EPWNITDQIIDQAFANRIMHIQWVYDWHGLIEYGDQSTATDGSGPWATTACLTEYPETCPVMVYPAGTFVRGSADVINLNAVYAAASLAKTLFTGLFMERAFLRAHTCFSGCVVEIPVCNAGRTGAPDVPCA